MKKDNMASNLKSEHWESVYASKLDNEVSWYQENPEASLDIIEELNIQKNEAVIDIGGGNSNLVICLNKKGFENISVLDISAKAIERTQKKLGDNAKKVNWIVSDILEYKPNSQFKIWHDRATFHFLTDEKDIKHYVKLATSSITLNGYFIIATFAPSGPTKCSGLPISQYGAQSLKTLFSSGFKLIKSWNAIHKTPFNTTQNFTYVLFQKIT